MTLKLAIEITADATGAKKGVGEARAELDGLAADAKSAGTAVAQAMDTVADAEREAGDAAKAAAAGVSVATKALEAQQAAATTATRALSQLTAQERQASAAMRAANGNSVNSASAINARLGVRDSFAGPDRAKEIADYGRALDDLKARYSPLYAAQRQYKAQLAEIREAEKIGALSAREAAAEITRTKAAFAGQATMLRAQQSPSSSAWSKLRTDQKTNVTAQGFDVFTSLAGGMNPALIAAQQGPQVIQAFGGVSETLSALRGLLTPVTLGVAGLTAAVALGAVAWNDYLTKTKEAATVASSFGQAQGISAREIEQVAEATSAAGVASVSQARAIGVELTRTGKIGVEQFGSLIGISRNFAATMQTDVASGSQQLAKLFADPAAGAAQLRSIGLLDGATERLVTRLASQNKTTEAQQVLLRGLTPRLADAASATTALGRAAEWAGQKWDNAWNSIGRSVDRLMGGGPGSLEERLAELQQALANPTVAGRLQGPQRNEKLKAEIADIQEQIRLRNRAQAMAGVAAADDRLGSEAVQTANASPALALQQRKRALEDEIARLEAGKGKGGQTAEEERNITTVIEAKQRALDGLNRSQERATDLARLDAQISNERNPAARAELVARREALALSGEEIGTEELKLRVQEARTRAQIEGAAATSSAARQMMDSQRDQSEMLKLEISLIGQSEEARARAIALLQTEQQIRAQGIGSGSAAAAKLQKDAVAIADLGTTLNKQREALDTFRYAGEQTIDSLGEGLIGYGQSWQDVGDTITNVANDLLQTFARLAVMNPLKNALFGTNYATSADMTGGVGGGGLISGLGSMFSGMFGGSAGTVGITTGAIMAKAGGGPIHGPGTGTSDSILARVSNGEYVVNARATAANRATLDRINYGQLPGFAAGGMVGGMVGRGAPGAGGSGAPSVKVQVINNSGAQVGQPSVSMGADGVPVLSMVIEAVRADLMNDLAQDGTFSQGMGRRFGLSAARGL